jgi:Xaa-Pro dipeptidase
MATALRRMGINPPPSWAGTDRVRAMDEREGLPFPHAEYVQRRKRIAAEMAARDIEAVLVFRPSSVEYVCGFHTVAEPIPIPAVILPDHTAVCLLEFEAGRAVVSSRADEILYYSRADDGLNLFVDYVAQQVSARARVAVDMAQPWVPPKVIDLLRRRGLEPVDAPLAELARLILSETELSYMREAARVTGLGIEAAVQAARDRAATDASIAAAIREALTANANSLAGLDVIVAAGWAGGIPHSTWGHRPIDRREPVVLEFAGAHHRYCAPVMRTLVFGELTGEAARLDELAGRTFRLLMKHLRPGRRCSEVARAVTEGLGEVDEWVVFHFVYGYPVGLTHPPTWMDGYPFYLSEQNDGTIQPGMAFHCPASFRSFGRRGVCYSQTVVIGDDGPEVITPGPASVIHV